MRDDVREFVRIAASTFTLREPIYEFGAFLVEDQVEKANLRQFFPGKKYVGCDMRPGLGVDRVEDVMKLTLPDECAATILCLDTLEHVFDPIRAVGEMIRVLAPGGTIILSAPFDFRVHDYPSDYWRITPSCLTQLLAPCEFSLIGWQGTEVDPHTVTGIGVKAPVPRETNAQAQQFVQSYTTYLSQRKAQQPWKHVLKTKLLGWAQSKHEYRRQTQYFHSGFSFDHASNGQSQEAVSSR